MQVAGWKYFTTMKQWERYLKDLLKANDKALLKAIVLIYDSQTSEEQAKGQSIEDNAIGFTKVDAEDMGAIARKIKRGEQLTKGELAKSRNKMGKYWKQLMVISKEQQRAQEAREQQELNEKLAKEEIEAREQDAQAQQMFREHNEVLRRCAEEGVACSYGICDECPVTQGLQMRLYV